MGFFGFDWRHDPGPCIVCGAPHTTCVSPDYAAQQRAQQATATTPAPTAEPEPSTFTTATYSRKKHGRKAPR